MNYLVIETKELEGKLKHKKEEAYHSIWKANEVMKVIWKIQEYIRNPSASVNKAKSFYSNLAKAGPILGAKVVTILVNFFCKSRAFSTT